MLIKENTTIERDVYVAPCLECGCSDIQLSDNNYSSFNQGGGKCKACGHTTYAGVGCLPKMDDLIAIWNAGNDIKQLIEKEQNKILVSFDIINVLQQKLHLRNGSTSPNNGFYRITPKESGVPYMSKSAPDSWELRECHIEWIEA